MTRKRRSIFSGGVAALALQVLLFLPAASQQINDPGYRFDNSDPVFERDHGPSVCVDEAHHNVHTVNGLYAPFAEVLRSDGFRPRSFSQAISRLALDDCDVLILGNAQVADPDPDSPDFWRYPHASAYSSAELDAVVGWIREGGAVLLFADHSLGAGAAGGMTALLGVQSLDAWATNTPRGNYPEMFRRGDGLLMDHPILRSRTPRETIDSIATNAGGAFFLSEWVEPLIVFGAGATGWVMLGEMGQDLRGIPEEEWPKYDIEGWILGGTRDWGEGRFVIFGDVAACTAQLYGPESSPVGMNHSAAEQNALFCLNMVRWLARAL